VAKATTILISEIPLKSGRRPDDASVVVPLGDGSGLQREGGARGEVILKESAANSA
jgi:hypothetical protein